MSQNKKIHYGDGFEKSINDDITPPPPPDPATGKFTFDRMDITFDTMIRTFDEI